VYEKRRSDFSLNMQQKRLAAWLRPDPLGEGLQRFPNPLAGFKGRGKRKDRMRGYGEGRGRGVWERGEENGNGREISPLRSFLKVGAYQCHNYVNESNLASTLSLHYCTINSVMYAVTTLYCGRCCRLKVKPLTTYPS